MKVIGTGPAVAIILTLAEFEQLKVRVAQGEPPRIPPAPIAVPNGIPVYVNRYLTESVVVCESEAPRLPSFEWSRCRQ